MFVSGSSSSLGMFVVESDRWFSFEFSDNGRDGYWWWDFDLKVNVIFYEVTFKFFYLHLFEESIDDISKLYFECTVYNLLTVLWTKYYLISLDYSFC